MIKDYKNINYSGLIKSIEKLVVDSRKTVISTVNFVVIYTNWTIGQYIVEFEQNGLERAKYGDGLLKQLSSDLTENLGRGYSYRNLQLFKKFYISYPIMQSAIAQIDVTGYEKLQSMIAQSKLNVQNSSFFKLTWTHLVRLMSVIDEKERLFYMNEASENNWSVRELNRQIEVALYERVQLSKKKIDIPKLENNFSENLLKDPYILEFLKLPNNREYSESDLEQAIINQLELFLLELGKGFSFVARQHRITSGADHFYIDLVFYNRLLRCHILIDLKIGKLKHQDIGQMQMYVNYFDREVKNTYENPTIGIILCKEKDDFVVEYSLPLNNKQIYPKEYQLYLPNKKQLKKLLEKYL